MSAQRRFGPKDESFDGSTVPPCSACGVEFKAGDYSTLVKLGPGDDSKARERLRQGKPYIAVAVEVHWACATGEEL